MGQCLKHRNCSKRKVWENSVCISWGSLALLYPREPGEPGAHSELGEHSSRVSTPGPILPQHWDLGLLSGRCCRELATLRLGRMQTIAREWSQNPISIHTDSPKRYFLLFLKQLHGLTRLYLAVQAVCLSSVPQALLTNSPSFPISFAPESHDEI